MARAVGARGRLRDADAERGVRARVSGSGGRRAASDWDSPQRGAGDRPRRRDRACSCPTVISPRWRALCMRLIASAGACAIAWARGRVSSSRPPRARRDTCDRLTAIITAAAKGGDAMSTLQLDETGLITTCPNCGQRNRIAFNAREARCGKCKADLPSASEPIEVPDEAAFDALIRKPRIRWSSISGRHGAARAGWSRPRWRVSASSQRRPPHRREGEYRRCARAGERFRIRSIPTMAVFDGDGKSRAPAGQCRPRRSKSFVRGAVPGRF